MLLLTTLFCYTYSYGAFGVFLLTLYYIMQNVAIKTYRRLISECSQARVRLSLMPQKHKDRELKRARKAVAKSQKKSDQRAKGYYDRNFFHNRGSVITRAEVQLAHKGFQNVGEMNEGGDRSSLAFNVLSSSGKKDLSGKHAIGRKSLAKLLINVGLREQDVDGIMKKDGQVDSNGLDIMTKNTFFKKYGHLSQWLEGYLDQAIEKERDNRVTQGQAPLSPQAKKILQRRLLREKVTGMESFPEEPEEEARSRDSASSVGAEAMSGCPLGFTPGGQGNDEW